MLRDAAAQPTAHLPAHLLREVEIVGPSEFAQTLDRRLLIPRFEVERGEDVGVSTQFGPLEDRFETHAARHDHRDPSSVRLPVLSEPAQEFIRVPPALGRHFEIVALQKPIHQDREFIDRKDHGSSALCQRRKHRVTLRTPIPRVDSRTQLHPEFAHAEFVDTIHRCARRLPDPIRHAAPGAPNPPRRRGDLHDGVRGRRRVLEIDEHGREVALIPQASQKLSDQTRLPHPALGGDQRMDAVPDALHEGFYLDIPVEEAVTLDPVSSRLPQTHIYLPSILLATNMLATIALGSRCDKGRRGSTSAGSRQLPQARGRDA